MMPNKVAELNNLACQLLTAGQPGPALTLLNRAWQIHQNVEIATNMGIAFDDLNDRSSAEDMYQIALRIDPRSIYALTNYANLCNHTRRPVSAERMFAELLKLNPDDEYARIGMSVARLECGRPEASLDVMESNGYLDRNPSQIYLSTYCAHSLHIGYSAVRHRQWYERFGNKLHREFSKFEPPIRVAFLSSNFRHHTMAHYLSPLLMGLDLGLIEPIMVDATPQHLRDEVNQDFQLYCSKSIDVTLYRDEQAADLLANEQVAVVVDLDGHKFGNRLGILCYNPAPVQLGYIGYVASTFVSENIDTLIRWAYQPYRGGPKPSIPPVVKNKYITFGYCGRAGKIKARTAKLWGLVMTECPTARFRVFSDGGEVTTAIRERLENYGVPSDRLDIIERKPKIYDYLEELGNFDVQLDPIPFNGFANTCELLWQGIPTMTMPVSGESYSQAGGWFMNLVGCAPGIFIAQTDDDYVRQCGQLARADDDEIGLLKGLRSALRYGVENGPLSDGAGVAARFTRLCYERLAQAKY